MMAMLANLSPKLVVAHGDESHDPVCKPVNLIMTRASGSIATFTNGSWSTAYGLSSVNSASVQGAFKFIMSETIDKDTGYTNITDDADGCYRKNYVSYIHFYNVSFCNPNEALWWFNTGTGYRPADYANDTEAYSFGEYGHYLTFDNGACDKNSPFCSYLNGDNNSPILGPFVGWQDQEADARNPTDRSYWYSLPGECPGEDWDSADKSEACKIAQPTGACPAGVTPDGKTCTWSYELLGQVILDDVAGITSIPNPDTGLNFVNASEFCLAGNVEFERDSTTFEFVQGLDFWKNPLNKTANTERVSKLLAFYDTVPNNIALPTASDLLVRNPRCYESVPNCYDASTKMETCTRNSEMLCVACDKVTGGCAAVTDESTAFNAAGLEAVALPGQDDSDESDDSSFASTASFSWGMMSGVLMAMTFTIIY